MNEQLLDTYRKASESWLKMQQELFQQGARSPLFAAPQGAAAAPDWARDAQKKWIDLAAGILDHHRESIDGLYKSAIHLFQQTSQVPEAKPGANGAKVSKAALKPSPRTSRRSRSVAGRRPERSGAGKR